LRRLVSGVHVNELNAGTLPWCLSFIPQPKMSLDWNDVQQVARQCFDILAFTSFENCQPLSREFENVPTRSGLYAFRHRNEGLLYIGKAKNLRDRLRGGHKAFLWGWLDRYEPDDVRISFSVIQQWQRPGLSYELETLILQAANPPYNVKIPREI
jgi:hypothetical protein